MSSTVKWAAGWVSRGTVLTTELNSLAAAATSAAGTAFDNTSNLDQYFAFEFSSTFASAAAAGSYMTVIAVQSLDGTNYPVKGDQVVNITVDVTTSAQRCTNLFPVLLGPGKWKFFLQNNTDKTLAASANTLTIYSTNDNAS